MFEIDKQKFGAFVAELRKEKGYTQKELSTRLFISDKAVSKWETGASIPDTALLIPLADLLGVTVTELLMCERMEATNTVEVEQVETIVKTAISISDEEQQRAYQTRSKWAIIYVASMLIGGAGLLLHALYWPIAEALLVMTILGGVFGAYFCFWVKTKLPAYYDENRICAFSDGIFRMNVPGVSFNNSNWPHVVKVVRLWTCLVIVVFPWLSVAMNALQVQLWSTAENIVLLVLLLGGLFIPMYVVGKKYE